MDTMVSEFGISCEACHGPAREHVQIVRDEKPDEDPVLRADTDLAIVNPKSLGPRRSSKICGQCHGVTQYRNEKEFEHWKVHGYSYRPGDSLLATRFVVRPSADEPSFREMPSTPLLGPVPFT